MLLCIKAQSSLAGAGCAPRHVTASASDAVEARGADVRVWEGEREEDVRMLLAVPWFGSGWCARLLWRFGRHGVLISMLNFDSDIVILTSVLFKLVVQPCPVKWLEANLNACCSEESWILLFFLWNGNNPLFLKKNTLEGNIAAVLKLQQQTGWAQVLTPPSLLCSTTKYQY